MDRVLIGENARLLSWAEEMIGIGFAPDAKAIGWGDEVRVRAVTVYDRFSDGDVCIHLASDQSRTWLHRPMLCASFAYPFVQLGLRRMTALIAATNTPALRFNRHIGFTQEGVLRNGNKDCDLIVLGMLREECRWIPEEFRRG